MELNAPFARNIDVLLYWTILVISILGNFILSIVLVPFLLTMSGIVLYASIFFIAATFGYFFNFILNGLEQLQPRQHVIAGILIPALALINITIITLLSNKLIVLLDLATLFHSPALIGIIYVLGYTFPGGIVHLLKKI